MTEYAVRLIDNAERDLNRFDSAIQRRIFKRLDWLRFNVESITPAALTGRLAGLYKLRVRDYRVLYEILKEEQVILVQRVGHRREVYRNL